ncbi:hypothetical protein H5J22_02635 [Cetobacterium sp. 8H]|uniref:PIN-like domain-containing protein n=1 Tax=Cetobacterium sp. 8H TaxID=2759681 RepID=UPI00163B6E6F|nr:PIN-like domain-containing protein [Cetobacterium sp. 8H]MBC2850340.1 hypothetical protein [Cetobacterium sp. 8H]
MKKNYVVIFDTNVLFDLYQKEGIYFDLILDLEKIKNNIIIPNQVYEEYISKLERIKIREMDKYDKTEQRIKKIYQDLRKNKEIESDFQKIFGHSNLFDNLIDTIEKKCHEIEIEIKNVKMIKEEKENTLLKKDILKELIEEIMINQKLKKFTLKEFIEIFKEGEERLKYKIPPGITDANKGVGTDFKIFKNKYGDFIIWKEILQYAKLNPNIDIYFIENERKSDWWEIKGGNEFSKILEKEFQEYSQSKIIALNLESFFKEFKEKLNLPDFKLQALEEHIEALEYTIIKIQENLEDEFFFKINLNYFDNIFKYLENNLLYFIEENDYGYIISNEITGDRFEYINDLEVYLVKAKNCILEKKGLNDIVIKGEIEIECELNFQVSQGRDVGFSKNVSLVGNLFLEMNLYNFSITSKEFKDYSCDIGDFKLASIDADETELDIYYDYEKEY